MLSPARACCNTCLIANIARANRRLTAQIGWNGGTDAQTIVEGIEATEDVPGRMHVIDEEQPFGVIVDSAGTPSALSRLLDDVRDLQFMPRLIGGRIGTKVRRIILVVGVKGDAPPAMRPLVGEVAHWKVRCSQQLPESKPPGP